MDLTPQEEQEILETFVFESKEIHQRIDELLTLFENDPGNKETIADLLRVLHTLKGNAMSLGFKGIADLSHCIEDVFATIKSGVLHPNKEVCTNLFKASDKIKELLDHLNSEEPIPYRGIKTKLEVMLRNAKGEELIVPLAAEESITVEQIAADTEWTNESPADSIRELPVIEEELVEESLPSGSGFFARLMGRIFGPRFARHSAEVSSNEASVYAEADNNEHGFPSFKEDRPSMTIDDEASVMELISAFSSEEMPQTEEAEIEAPTLLEEDLKEKVEIAEYVQVPIRKLDMLMNQVGQLIIERDRLASKESSRARKAELAGLHRITSDLQYSVMNVRLVQLATLFGKFHRVVRDVAHVEQKQVTLEIKGGEVEIDRSILKIMSDSMIHLVRNAISHGIETPEERTKAGKKPSGTVTLSARSDKEYVIIDVKDDGKGINAQHLRKKLISNGMATAEQVTHMADDEVIKYIFLTGFSNSDTVNEISGRGVGMDVVKKSAESIGGVVSIETKVGQGTSISLRLPSSMAVKGVLMFMMKDQEFAIPLAYTESVISLKKSEIRKAGLGLMSTYLKKTISIVFFSDLLRMHDLSEIYETGKLHDAFDQCEHESKLELIVINYADRYFGIVVDKLLQQKEIIEKPMPKPLDNTVLLSGTTILGTGNICMIIDVPAITEILYASRFNVYESKKAS